MDDFLKFVDELKSREAFHLEIYYSSIMDWCIRIYKKGASENGTDLNMVDETDLDMELCFAKAHVALKEWLLENNGGY